MSEPAIALICLAVIAASVAITVIVLKNDFGRFLSRMIRVGPDGIDLTPPDQQQARVEAARVRQQELAPPAAAPNPAFEHWHRQLQEAIDRSGHRGSPALVPELENTIVVAARLIDFHVTARWIFGTQIAALRALDAAPDGASLDGLEPIFQLHVARVAQAGNPDFVPDILQWISYLPNQHLVAFQDGRYRINPAGRDFLQFANLNGFNEGKPL